MTDDPWIWTEYKGEHNIYNQNNQTMNQCMSDNEIINNKIKSQEISKQKQNKYGQVVKGEYEPPWQRVSVEDVYQLISEKGLVFVDGRWHC